MKNHLPLTREKHLDHLVRVVPLLALAYGIQGYLMMSWASDGNPTEGPTGLLVLSLGVSLALSVMMMVTYDLRHQVSYGDAGFKVRAPWQFSEKSLDWQQVKEVEIIGGPEEFQTVVVKLQKRGSYTFYFVDNGHEFKKTFELMTKSEELKQAA